MLMRLDKVVPAALPTSPTDPASPTARASQEGFSRDAPSDCPKDGPREYCPRTSALLRDVFAFGHAPDQWIMATCFTSVLAVVAVLLTSAKDWGEVGNVPALELCLVGVTMLTGGSALILHHRRKDVRGASYFAFGLLVMSNFELSLLSNFLAGVRSAEMFVLVSMTFKAFCLLGPRGVLPACMLALSFLIDVISNVISPFDTASAQQTNWILWAAALTLFSAYLYVVTSLRFAELRAQMERSSASQQEADWHVLQCAVRSASDSWVMVGRDGAKVKYWPNSFEKLCGLDEPCELPLRSLLLSPRSTQTLASWHDEMKQAFKRASIARLSELKAVVKNYGEVKLLIACSPEVKVGKVSSTREFLVGIDFADKTTFLLDMQQDRLPNLVSPPLSHEFDKKENNGDHHGVPVKIPHENPRINSGQLSLVSHGLSDAQWNENELTHDKLDDLIRLGKSEHWLIEPDLVLLKPSQVLGQGAYGQVIGGGYLGSRVAIKVPQNQRRLQLPLLNELRLLRHLRHPNIVLFFGACLRCTGFDMAVIFEYVEGPTLSAYISKDKQIELWPKTEATKLGLIYDIALALAYLHGQSSAIVHGDLKAGNIFVDMSHNGVKAKVGDFGISRKLSRKPQRMGGTVRWTAPEIILDSAPASTALDTYAFGCIVSFIVSELVPFHEHEQHEVVELLVKGERPKITWVYRTQFEANMSKLGEKCCRVRQRERPCMQDIVYQMTGGPVWTDADGTQMLADTMMKQEKSLANGCGADGKDESNLSCDGIKTKSVKYFGEDELVRSLGQYLKAQADEMEEDALLPHDADQQAGEELDMPGLLDLGECRAAPGAASSHLVDEGSLLT